MWHFISDTISSAIGDVFICESAKQIHRQHNHVSYVLKGSQRRFFVKLSDTQHYQASASPLACEAEGLRALLSTQTFKCPQVICHGEFAENQKHYEYLVLQYICFKSPSQEFWCDAGGKLAALHLSPVSPDVAALDGCYGWPINNFIGATEQVNSPNSNWRDFFIQNRIEYYLHHLTCAAKIVDQTILALIDTHLAKHNPRPSLLHGDLWHGNIGFSASAPVIYDPAVWLGDPECDLAMAELFGGFAKGFFAAYQEQLPPTPDYDTRRPIYQLPHALNHWLMFGDSYRGLVESVVAKIRGNS